MKDEIDAYWRHHRAQVAMNEASSKVRDASPEEALDALDRVDLHMLSSYEIAHWFNTRAYVLALMGATREALEHLHEAEELIDLETSAHPAHDALLLSCIIGTRGIALLQGDMADEAERCLGEALRRGEPFLEAVEAELVEAARWLQAERLWWLAQIAEKRGDSARRLQLLHRAATFCGTRFGDRARQVLGA